MAERSPGSLVRQLSIKSLIPDQNNHAIFRAIKRIVSASQFKSDDSSACETTDDEPEQHDGKDNNDNNDNDNNSEVDAIAIDNKEAEQTTNPDTKS